MKGNLMLYTEMTGPLVVKNRPKIIYWLGKISKRFRILYWEKKHSYWWGRDKFIKDKIPKFPLYYILKNGMEMEKYEESPKTKS
jgi:hypothetical protein